MNHIAEGVSEAFRLMASLDREVLAVALLTFKVTVASVTLAGLIGVPLGAGIALTEFRGKRAVVTVLNTLLSFPTVLIGLTVYSLVCRRGPFGALDILYTPAAIVVGDVILATPVIAALSLAAARSVDPRARATALSLGATRAQSTLKVLHEARFAIFAAVVAGTGRVIAEVGSAMMIGGNIEGYTRTLTTAISLETSRGEFGLAIALGIILLVVALGINVVLQYFQQKDLQ